MINKKIIIAVVLLILGLIGIATAQLPQVIIPIPTSTGGGSIIYINGSANHNDLQNIQGGATNDYYHLTNAEWSNRIYLYNQSTYFQNWLNSFLYNYNQTSNLTNYYNRTQMENGTFAKYQFINNNFNGSGNFATTGNVSTDILFFGTKLLREDANSNILIGDAGTIGNFYNSIIMGTGAAGGTESICIGDLSSAGDYAVNIGAMSYVGDNSVSIGGQNYVGSNSIAIGATVGTGDNEINIGNYIDIKGNVVDFSVTNLSVGGKQGLTHNYKMLNASSYLCWMNYTGGILTWSNC